MFTAFLTCIPEVEMEGGDVTELIAGSGSAVSISSSAN